MKDMENESIFESRIDLKELNQAVNKIRDEVSKVIVGQREMIDMMLAGILANGHILLEGVPGIAKTLAAKLIAKSINSGFSRIQFTPDLMPSDVVGTNVFNTRTSAFELNKGPVFSNLVLIDEINRAPAKTQSALFEVMEERQVSIDGVTYPMEQPFLVLATQNPIEHEGTYRLPEAQLDRFLFKINIKYPDFGEEVTILNRNHQRKGKKEINEVTPVIMGNKIVEYQQQVKEIHIEDNLVKYIAQVVDKTRNNSSLYLGASPRASINIMSGSKAFAAMQGRDFVKPEDIKTMLEPVLCHRILLTPEKEMEGRNPEDVIKEIVDSVEIPR